jgi:hypothetical protein
MSEVFVPLVLALAGLITALVAYRGIRRGGARFYTLEREAILRRASLTLIGSVLLFLAAVGLLVYQHQQRMGEEAAAEGEFVEGVVTRTPTPALESFPPTGTPTATPDLAAPTATPTAVICRAVVEGTFDNGLTLRDTPNGEELDVLAEGSILTLLDEEPTEAGSLLWRNVRTVFGDEGWVAEDYLEVGSACDQQE